MHFIVFDLELNQDFSSIQITDNKRKPAPFEIIQIGAIKLDADFNTVDTFNRFIKPTFYTKISPFITELTGITTEQLQTEKQFLEIYNEYIEFIGGTDSIFCTWGTSDIKELFKNAELHNLSTKPFPRDFINIQPYVSLYFNFSAKNLLRLEHAVEALNIQVEYTFHDAFHDAYYTAEIFKKVYNSFIQPKIYDPSHVYIKPRQPKRSIDIDGLVKQFEKMYDRSLTDVEQDMIIL